MNNLCKTTHQQNITKLLSASTNKHDTRSSCIFETHELLRWVSKTCPLHHTKGQWPPLFLAKYTLNLTAEIPIDVFPFHIVAPWCLAWVPACLGSRHPPDGFFFVLQPQTRVRVANKAVGVHQRAYDSKSRMFVPI